jgi:DNA-binding winged helix-turn-helix (wHTH) protein
VFIDMSSSVPSQPAFAFADFRLEPDGTLYRADAIVHLVPKELAALRLLLENAGRVVTASEIKQALWGDIHVTGDSVLHCISSLRARLGAEQRILTVYKRGYRFAGPVRRAAAEESRLPRLAIVPFDCSPGVPREMGELIADETLASLTTSAASLVSVLARDSAFALARKGLTAQQVGESLQADMVLAGTLRALPAHLRVRAEMVRVNDGAQIWVEDLFLGSDPAPSVQPLLAARIACRLRGQLGANALPSLAATFENT